MKFIRFKISKTTSRNKGAAMIMVLMFSIILSGLVMAYMNYVSILSKAVMYKLSRYRCVNIAEAGINRIAWYLENTAPGGSTNGTWRGAVSENISITETGLVRNYTYSAASSDLPLEGPVISASSVSGTNVAANTMDNNLTTFWRSTAGAGTRTLTFFLAINGDYTMYVSRTRIMLGSGTAGQFPADYTWQVSTNGAAWTTVATKTGNAFYDVTDTFINTAVLPATLYQANYIRLNVTNTIGGPANPVNIAEVEIFGVAVPATPSASSTQGANVAASARDNSLATYWQSSAAGVLPQTLTLTFPSSSNYSVNKIRMRLGTGAAAAQFPQDYTWSVSSDGASWTTVVTQAGNASTDVTDTFALQSNVNYVRINVTTVSGGGNQANIGEVDVPAVCMSSTCRLTYSGTTTGLISYYAAQNAIVDGTSPPSVSGQPKMLFGAESQ